MQATVVDVSDSPGPSQRIRGTGKGRSADIVGVSSRGELVANFSPSTTANRYTQVRFTLADAVSSLLPARQCSIEE